MPGKKKPLSNDEAEAPLEDQPTEWSEEDRKIEGRKPDLGKTEDDASEL